MQPLLWDTCAAIWISEKATMSQAALDALSKAHRGGVPSYISPITAWEIGMLASRGRLQLLIRPERWISNLFELPGVKLAEMSPFDCVVLFAGRTAAQPNRSHHYCDRARARRHADDARSRPAGIRRTGACASAGVLREGKTVSVTNDWFWEGNVVDAVARHLAVSKWRIISKADTRSKARGPDIHAERDDGASLLVEVKGFPSKLYRDERRVNEIKPTNPNNQAQQWYSHAVLKALRLRNRYSDSTVALAFPDHPRYRALFSETKSSLQKLGIVLFFVNENGAVQECR
jgi:PIN domain nuclease of toxin-antitoxin system